MTPHTLNISGMGPASGDAGPQLSFFPIFPANTQLCSALAFVKSISTLTLCPTPWHSYANKVSSPGMVNEAYIQITPLRGVESFYGWHRKPGYRLVIMTLGDAMLLVRCSVPSVGS